MAGTRKRKHDAGEMETAGSHIKRQRGIQAFGNVGKAQHVKAGKDVKSTPQQKCPQTPPPPPLSVIQAPNEAKRKRPADSDSEPDERDGQRAPPQANVFKQFAKKKALPPNKRKKQDRPPTLTETPRSKAATDLFDRLKLDQRGAIPLALECERPDTPPHTPKAATILPAELQALVSLYAAFLTSLSLYSAHNRESTGMQVSSLLPVITKNWKKRTVGLDDLQLLLGVDAEAEEFQLEDYGRAGIRLGVLAKRESGNRIAGLFNDDARVSRFETALHVRWDQHCSTMVLEDACASAFLKQLPRLEIKPDVSTRETAPLFARGKQRLADVKADRAATMATEATRSATIEVGSGQKTLAAVQSRGTSLIDRIMAKQSLTASLPAGPTREELARKAALHRIEDVTRVVGLLAGTKTRISYSMPTIVQQLQQSLRNPISRDEVERCLRLMADEISPEFVRVVQTGGVQGVIISRIGRVGLEELRERIKHAGGA